MARPDRIAVIGLWHLGSVAAASWAELGHNVIGLDSSPRVVEGFRAGRAPIFEPGLDELIQANVQRGRLTFSTEVREAIPEAGFVFMAFDTPVDSNDRSDMAPLERAIRDLSPLLKERAIVIVSSQVPVGTCARWRQEIHRTSPGRSLELAYSPENLRLGEAIHCYLHPDRIVVGADDGEARQRVADLFAPMGAPVLPMTLASAEMAKHALNSFLATSVSFINEIATLCEISGADVLSVAEALKTDPRIGHRAFLSPGFGFAGGTLARDLQVLRELGRTGRAGTPLLDGVLDVNRARSALVLRRLRDLYGKVEGHVIGVLGLTYKAGTSTLRRSVALEVIGSLVSAGARVRAFDPKADLSELGGPPAFEPVADAYEAARGASALVVLTEWSEFASLDFDRIKAVMGNPVILDGKNLLAGLRLGERGFRYMGVGR
jgi:UDPglucose 6-dehydrogenase